MNLDPRLCVFLGDNGSGKTSVIEGLSIPLSRIFPSCDSFPSLDSLPYSADIVKVRGSFLNGRYKRSLAETSSAVVCLSGACCENAANWCHSISDGVNTHSGASNAVAGVERNISKIFNGWKDRGVGVPVFARYGAYPVAVEHDNDTAKSGKVDFTNPFASYIDSLRPSLDFDSFMDWFYDEEANELREQRRNHDYVSPELEAVRVALERVFAASRMRISNPRFEANPKRFVMSCTGDDGAEVELVFDQLSDGYRRMVALVADFARRLAIANRYAGGNPLDGPGVLMIDEVDAHLHPKWQYRVIGDLQRTFPNVQLIVTTHSAEVVSTVDKKHVYILEPEDGVVHEKHPEQQTEGSYPEDIASMVMGAPNHVDTVPAYQAYLRCLGMIQEGGQDTIEYHDAFDKVLKHYGQDHYFTKELISRVGGMKRRRAMLDRLYQGRR
ncbi:MAG: AAA family ATPase [Akkermansia sp.]|nr:AAA family ATPase [Akkermansia sp.]